MVHRETLVVIEHLGMNRRDQQILPRAVLRQTVRERIAMVAIAIPTITALAAMAMRMQHHLIPGVTEMPIGITTGVPGPGTRLSTTNPRVLRIMNTVDSTANRIPTMAG